MVQSPIHWDTIKGGFTYSEMLPKQLMTLKKTVQADNILRQNFNACNKSVTQYVEMRYFEKSQLYRRTQKNFSNIVQSRFQQQSVMLTHSFVKVRNI